MSLLNAIHRSPGIAELSWADTSHSTEGAGEVRGIFIPSPKEDNGVSYR